MRISEVPITRERFLTIVTKVRPRVRVVRTYQCNIHTAFVALTKGSPGGLGLTLLRKGRGITLRFNSSTVEIGHSQNARRNTRRGCVNVRSRR
eukprot:9497370-Pyramimonas_sp.AAC.1